MPLKLSNKPHRLSILAPLTLAMALGNTCIASRAAAETALQKPVPTAEAVSPRDRFEHLKQVVLKRWPNKLAYLLNHFVYACNENDTRIAEFHLEEYMRFAHDNPDHKNPDSKVLIELGDVMKTLLQASLKQGNEAPLQEGK